MIKALLPIAIIFAATAAAADGYYTAREGIVVEVEPVYSTTYNPVVQERCFEAQVPVYSQQQHDSGDTLAGAIIGGAIGNQFGNGDGKDAMTILGAIVGADQASRPSNHVVGYTTEWRCEMVQTSEEQRVFHHYQVTYKIDGQYRRINTDRNFRIGERIVINE